jgi:large subunit ribosomal protein L2
MGKRITSQARGRGGPAFKVKRKAYKYRIDYPKLSSQGVAKIIKLFNSGAHTAPIAKVEINSEFFYVPAAQGVYEGQEIYIGKRTENKPSESGDILSLSEITQGTKVFNIESIPGGGGKIARGSGTSAIVSVKDSKGVEVIIKRRKIKLNEKCRAIVGIVAGEGRTSKPLIKAGKKHHMKKARGKKWHRTSAVKVNAIDHPFGGGRGKRIKSKISKRNSSPGQKVGHIRPRKTGKKK